MKARSIVLVLAGAILAPALARGDCHDALTAGRTGDPGCRGAVMLYAQAWSGQSSFEAVLTSDVQLTVEESPRETTSGRERVNRKLTADRDSLGGQVKYTIDRDRIAGGHLSVGGFLGIFGRNTFENMGQLSWNATLEGSRGRKREHVEAIVVRVLDEGQRPRWLFVVLQVKRTGALRK
ncbi:MAG TPA: hypothetical protein VFO85_13570 [Vicinamibacteria bacterium]|nr:hypothetical protein [Vicinamibacteria bacterium]